MLWVGLDPRFNFPIPFNGEIRVPIINAVIGDDGDGISASRPYVFVDDIQPDYIIFTNPDEDSHWRVFFIIEGSTNPDYLVSNNYGVEYYALCYIMKIQADGSPTVVTNNNPELLWGQTSTVGSVDGKALTVRMPANPVKNDTINQGRETPIPLKSIIAWDRMAVACNTTVADLKNIRLHELWGGAGYSSAYGGDINGTHADGSEFRHGDIILNCNLYHTFDEIMIIYCKDDGSWINSVIWKGFELTHMFQTFRRFNLLKQDCFYWDVNGSGASRPSKPFRDPDNQLYPTLLVDDNNCGIIDILGIKY